MIRAILAPLAMAFDQATRLRSSLYKKNILESVRLSRPVVSVGNLTVGGTGKTPVVDALLTQLERRKVKCAVLTRGYGRDSSQGAILVNAASKADEVGDEPLWLFQRHPQAQIAVGADRVRSSLDLEPDIFILDDGFQHLRVQRDVEIVLIDCSRPLWHYRPLPWGYAREGLESLQRAHMIIMTRVNQADGQTLGTLRRAARKLPHVQLIESSLLFDRCTTLLTSERVEIESKKVFIYSAIGNPESFRRTITDTGAVIVGEERSPDHAPADAGQVTLVMKKAVDAKADYVLLTEKDGVKWRELMARGGPVQAVPILIVVTTLNFEPPLPDIYDFCNNLSR